MADASGLKDTKDIAEHLCAIADHIDKAVDDERVKQAADEGGAAGNEPPEIDKSIDNDAIEPSEGREQEPIETQEGRRIDLVDVPFRGKKPV